MKVIFQIIKSAGIWIVLTIVALTADSIFFLSEKSEFFTAIFVIVPLVVAFWSPSKKIISWAIEYERSKPKKPPKPTPKPVAHTTVTPAIQRTVPQTKPRTPSLAYIDRMEGHDFEQFTADLLRKLGYERVQVTPGSGDQGVDVIAVKDGKKYAIQCKRYNQKLGDKPVQEVHAGKTIYGCNVAVVMTNNYFTDGGKEAARALGVELWDRDTLRRMLVYAEHREGK